MNKGTIIFDFDGTIADSQELLLDLFYELTGHEKLSDDEIAELRNTPILKAGKRVGISLRQVPRLLVKGRTLMRERISEVKVFPGLPEALKHLHESGWQLMVISSNSNQNVETYLKEHGLQENFDKIYGGVGLFSKAQSLRKVIRQNKLDRDACFYVGDEARDIQAARKAHVRSVAVTWGINDVTLLEKEKPFAVAEMPADFIKIFGSAEAGSN